MEFRPFVILSATGEEMPVQIVPAQEDDLQVTRRIPAWQTDWTSEFLAAPKGICWLMRMHGRCFQNFSRRRKCEC